MEFVRIINGCDNLWAVKNPEKDEDELTALFTKWNDLNYLFDFFKDNINDLKKYFNVSKISQAVKDTVDDAHELEELIIDLPYDTQLDELFKPLGENDNYKFSLARSKARNWNSEKHPSWLRIYAIRVECNTYIVTGGAIKLSPTMQDRKHTQVELDKLNKCKDYLKNNGVIDFDSFNDLLTEI